VITQALANSRNFMNPIHGITGFTSARDRLNDLENIQVDALGEAGSRLAGRSRLLDVVGVPSDVRGAVLLCGYIVAAAFGVFALLTPPGDLIGWAYIALAIVGYWFIPTRGLTTFLWLLIAVAGAAVALSGSTSGWVESGIGLALALVGLTPSKSRRAPVMDLLSQTGVDPVWWTP
jgi:hypothetical protein